jgi:hypothetical protein
MESPIVIPVTTQNYDWLPHVQTAISSNSKRHIILLAQREPFSGIVGLMNCIRKEPGSDLVRLETFYLNKILFFYFIEVMSVLVFWVVTSRLVMPRFRWLVTGLSSQRPVFTFASVHVGMNNGSLVVTVQRHCLLPWV